MWLQRLRASQPGDVPGIGKATASRVSHWDLILSLRQVGFIFNDKDAPDGVRLYVLSHFDFVLGYSDDGRLTSANVSSKATPQWNSARP